MGISFSEVLFLVSLVALYFIPRKSQKFKLFWIIPLLVFLVNLGIRFYFIHENHAKSNLITALEAKINTTSMENKDWTEFQTTLNAAQNDDRKSFNQLRIWSSDGSFPFHEEAKKYWSRLQKDHTYIEEYQRFKKLNTKQLEKIVIDENKRSLQSLVAEYKSLDPAQSPFVNYFYIIYIGEHRIDIPEKERLSFLIDIIKYDSSLSVAKFADLVFWELTNQIQDKWFDADITIKFWNDNKHQY